ncbi:MAG: TIGR02270 family protein [Rhodocyclaceae bacterium]|nr:TIGR02270 family protein [Rhodocyclaceae bacterium]
MPSHHPIPAVIAQHAEEAAILRNLRSFEVVAPHVTLHQLLRLDNRIAAHLDGLSIAGEAGEALCAEALEDPGIGELFAATIGAIERGDRQALHHLVAVVQAAPECENGFISAFGWAAPERLSGLAVEFLEADDPFLRRVGIACCAMHDVDPGDHLGVAMTDADVRLRARALRAAGECGRKDLLPQCLDALEDENPLCRFRAARSAVQFGDRGEAMRVLAEFAASDSPHHDLALWLFQMASELPTANALLQDLAQNAEANMRTLLIGAGVAGDPHYVPWLIARMEDPATARPAGEAFSLITGLDLAYLDLERDAPDEAEFGPTENADDEDVAMDPDESVPWPDAEKIATWWQRNGGGFTPGVRHFMGRPVTREHCLSVLRDGYQRQRIAAANHLVLLAPGAKLFNCAAPAWRQQSLLAGFA